MIDQKWARANVEVREALTLKELDRLDDEHDAEGAIGLSQMTDREIQITEQHFGQMLRRGRVVMAAREGDYDEAMKWAADDKSLARLAFEERGWQHRRGREKGDLRETDLPKTLTAVFDCVLQDEKRIRDIWKEKMGTKMKFDDRLAVAMKHWGLNPNDKIIRRQLLNYKKNHPTGKKKK